MNNCSQQPSKNVTFLFENSSCLERFNGVIDLRVQELTLMISEIEKTQKVFDETKSIQEFLGHQPWWRNFTRPHEWWSIRIEVGETISALKWALYKIKQRRVSLLKAKERASSYCWKNSPGHVNGTPIIRFHFEISHDLLDRETARSYFLTSMDKVKELSAKINQYLSEKEE